MQSANTASASSSDYEDLLSLWSDLESALAMLLAHPTQVKDFNVKVQQFDRWMQSLVAQDSDTALYLMFQLASLSTAGYSGAHALVCAVLCHIAAGELSLEQDERDSLVAAAMTMNIAMTALQDELAIQNERPNPMQQQAIQSHALRGRQLLEQLGVQSEMWLQVVALHDLTPSEKIPLRHMPESERLGYVLNSIDRYAAMISPRKSRPGRSIADSIRTVAGQDELQDEVGQALVRAVGRCPPGTFVRLNTGETAIVLRRSDRADHPLVASLATAQGAVLGRPHLYQTAGNGPHIEAALSHAAVRFDLNPRTMAKLGMFAAHGHSGSAVGNKT